MGPRSTTVTSPWQDCRSVTLIGFSPCWTLQHDSRLMRASSTIVTPLLVNLHWLRVLERIQYNLCVLVHRCLNGAAPQYLFELIQPLSDVDSRRRQRSVSTAEVLVPATLNHWRPCSCRRWSTYLEKSCSRSTPVPDIFHFRNTPEVTSV